MLLSTLRKLVATARSGVRVGSRADEESPAERPQYGVSVSYTPCPDCGEGTMTYDEAAETTRCSACGATPE